MTQITIAAQVVNGRLQHETNLADLEGQKVLATLTVVPNESPHGREMAAPLSSESAGKPDFDPEPPPWLEVEQDLYFPMMVPEILLGKVELHVKRGQPCIILPEELPDE